MKTKQEYSAGGVVYKWHNQEPLFLLGKHSGYHQWVLPKGLIEIGETPPETAVRETEEEMGVIACIVGDQPIATESYIYKADIKSSKLKVQSAKLGESSRRIEKYQEAGGGKVKVSKTVTFYLMEYVSGDPAKHGWEMEAAGWFTLDEAQEKMGFEGERRALELAGERVRSTYVEVHHGNRAKVNQT